MSTRRTGGKNGKRLVCKVLALALAAGVAGCGHSQMTTGSIHPASSAPIGQMTSTELNSTLVQLGDRYAANPKDKAISLKYASALQMDGRTDQSLAVMRKLVIYYPKDRDILAAYGKALAADGQLEQALDLKPNEPSVLSNLGMSYLLKGDLKTAETYLRSAVTQPGADSRVRQNLALVVGLQGRFDEAEKIASAELPPDQAAANVAYLRQMISQQNAWSQLKDGKKKKAAR
jgi:Flp pilus assembly protein TadD